MVRRAAKKSGEKKTAAEARAAGILNAVVPAAELAAKVKSFTDRIASKSPSTTTLGMRAFAMQDDLDLAAALPRLRDRLGAILATEDAREGLMAFLEKRAPQCKGRRAAER